MRSILLAVALSAAAVTAAHAETTPYQPAVRTPYGYSQTQTDVNRMRISFAGNAETNRETVELYLLFRTAELTLERGFDYFIVADHSVDARTEYAAAGPPVPPIVPPRRYREVSSYTAVSDVVMQKGERRVGAANAFDARTVYANLRGRIVRPR